MNSMPAALIKRKIMKNYNFLRPLLWGAFLKDKTVPTLELFYYDACPFCQFVLRTIKELKIKVQYCNIQENEIHLNRHIGATGRRTVPCLYIDNEPMFESSDIIQWLQSNQSRLEKIS